MPLPEITSNVSEALTRFLENHAFSSILVLVDENTQKYCYPVISQCLPEHHVIVISSGEEHKHLETCQLIWQQMTDLRTDRSALLINLGGGVIGDMGGFCAAAYKRGIAFINLPTTLLAQVDASIGGKLGIDFGPYKNHIGFFREPDLVMIAPFFLKTLPNRERMSGFAEIIKHALIIDHDHWQFLLSKPLGTHDLGQLIEHSVKLKADVVAQDPRESGLRKILNFGHTIGHAVEGYFLISDQHEKILHGEAVAAGMVMEGYLSVLKCGMDDHQLKDIEKLIFANYSKVIYHEEEMDAIARFAQQDKKNKGNKILSTLLDQPGKAHWDVEVTYEEIVMALKYYRDLDVVNL